MATIVFLLSFVLLLVMIVGLFKPPKVLKYSDKPSRVKVFLFFGIPAFVLFILYGQLYKSPLDVALENPEEAYQLKMNTGYLDEVPVDVAQLTNLRILDLNNNKITEIPDFVRDLKKLEVIDLGRNPIENIPNWMADMPALKELNLYQSSIVNIPEGLNKDIVNYEGSPLWTSEHPEKVAESSEQEETEESESTEEDHTESFGEFAMRKLLGKDYGYKRKFLKGEIYYNDPVTQEQTDKVGEIMQSMGFFNDEKEVSMLLDKGTEAYELKMVIDESQDIDDEVRSGFSALRGLVQLSAFPQDSLHLHLTDGRFETLETIK